MNLEQIERLRVPAEALAATEQSLRAAGREGFELFVLWSGRVDGEVFEVRTPHVPRQTAYRRRGGLMVRVEGKALHELNRWLYENEEVLAVQVHAHPREAYHSDTDDTYAIVTERGGFSIVAADFARRGLLSPETALYRLTQLGWQRGREAIEIIEVS